MNANDETKDWGFLKSIMPGAATSGARLPEARGWGEPDIKTAELEIELASIAVTHGSHPKVVEVTIGHLQKAIEALRPVRPNRPS